MVEENDKKDAFSFSSYIYFKYNPNTSDFYPRKEIKQNRSSVQFL